MKHHLLVAMSLAVIAGFIGAASPAKETQIPDGRVFSLDAAGDEAPENFAIDASQPKKVVITFPDGTAITARKCRIRSNGTWVCR
ncbi:hypothetical protein DEA8626_03100 [Defluviimonas aquaemixtae]|uniref:Uncharacterized protein n=1 Tax=Albidovulum aquaemixtae TaxID=1542388 RepID=A0A2R8BKU0_9RHOB|nr:hypothetical protein [Defluviimonas aquaemixtae]SPH24052.1 hypothetical protein DEA8626_03100 [Defluviimonas aquaemixtae]